MSTWAHRIFITTIKFWGGVKGKVQVNAAHSWGQSSNGWMRGRVQELCVSTTSCPRVLLAWARWKSSHKIPRKYYMLYQHKIISPLQNPKLLERVKYRTNSAAKSRNLEQHSKSPKSGADSSTLAPLRQRVL